MNTVILNGKKYEVDGTVSIINDRLYVNGQLFDNGEPLDRTVNITIVGDVQSVKLDKGPSHVSVKISGNVGGDVTTTSGDIDIAGDVTGDVRSTAGDIKCKNVSGGVKTVSGDINCSKIDRAASSVSGDVNGRNRIKDVFDTIFNL